jgi:hypothetical protein
MDELQAETADDRATEAMRVLLAHVQKYYTSIGGFQLLPGYEPGVQGVIDGLLILYYWGQKCTNFGDYYQLARTAYMCFTGKSPSARMMEFLFPKPETQGLEEVLFAMRSGFDTIKDVESCELVKKVRKMYTFLLVQGLLQKAGYEPTEDEMIFLEKKSRSGKFDTRMGLWSHAVDTALFICERFVSYRKTGSIDVFIREGRECENWLIEADRLISLGPFTSNLEPHGTTYFRFLSDLNAAIELGQMFAKAAKAIGAERTNPIVRKLGQLMFLKNSEVCKRSSLKSRQAPFGVLVYGHSGVAKSSFMKTLYHAFGSIHGLDRDDHYLYTRCPAEEYWNNFDSSMWAIQLDDIAFLKPGASSDVDPTLKELLNVVNNVPYNPPQAALEDKGKTPVLAKLVLATTNCEHLNASEYFHCPLAVRRRLPYVLEVKPKAQYLQPNGVFIQPTALPPVVGGFPDFWDITVKRIVPHLEVGGREMATLEVVKEFSDIRAFIRHFGEASKEHFVNQDKGEACDTSIRDVELCPMCCAYKQDCECQLQVDAQEVYSAVRECFNQCLFRTYVRILTYAITFQWFHAWCVMCARWSLTQRYFWRFVGNYFEGTTFARLVGDASVVVQNNKVKVTLVFLSILGVSFATYYTLRGAPKKEMHEPQGNILETTEDDFTKVPESNVWYRDTVELQQFQLPIASGSLVGKTPPQLRELFGRNVASVMIQSTSSSYKGSTKGFFYKGQFLVLNLHTLKDCTSFEITILCGLLQDGVRPEIKFSVARSDFAIDETLDLAMVRVLSIAPQRSLDRFWCDEEIPVTSMIGMRREKTGEVTLLDVHAVNFLHAPISGLVGDKPIFSGTSSEETKRGDCGTVYIANTPRGPTFVGFHVAGYGRQAAIMRVLKRDLEALSASLAPEFSVVSGEGAPVLSLQGTEVPLLAPHPKSVMRYLETGSCEQFGRIPGFLPMPTSKVGPTPLCVDFEQHYGVPSNYGKPVMAGWEPIRKNIIEMVRPVVNYDRSALDECKASYLQDLLQGLPDGWQGQLLELSDQAAVNGLPGVKYIDRINVNSSMGFPWNKTKKQFLQPAVSSKYPEGVTFDEDVWARVRSIDETYKQGRRAYPVFMGHNKDEAVTKAKQEAKKTRFFAGGPVDWSLEVRKRLLSFVKLVQENKMTFEAGPGTVCQSLEWQQMREYLTQFGCDQIVAGDYKGFDKHMIADFILAAFWIIAELHRAAGHSDEYARVIMGIGHDVAFPLMNVRGELIMFYGTNPSGHPLTVIINSLVNSLYMRYAYVKLGGRANTFKQSVALMTYGDDNVMGVSKSTPFFNHTAIQRELETIGVTYTMADKESESVPYIHIDDVSFLKRKWRFDMDVGAYLCPLEEDSIRKSLMCWLPSKTIDQHAQMVAVMQSAAREYFWYGREKFEYERKFLMSLASQEPYCHYVTDSTFPTWQELKDQFWGQSC